MRALYCRQTSGVRQTYDLHEYEECQGDEGDSLPPAEAFDRFAVLDAGGIGGSSKEGVRGVA